MAKRAAKTEPSWKDVKAKLTTFDHAGLVGLIHDLYAAQKESRTFLHTRFGLGEDILEPYKEVIDRWLWPDLQKNQDTSVTKAKQAIADYRKAANDPAGLAELKVFYCEQAAGFCDEYGFDGEAYFEALFVMFEDALASVNSLDAELKASLAERLEEVCAICEDFGSGLGDDMNDSLEKWKAENGQLA